MLLEIQHSVKSAVRKLSCAKETINNIIQELISGYQQNNHLAKSIKTYVPPV